MNKKLLLVFFIDAFGWQIAQRHSQVFRALLPYGTQLTSILGYSSACDPSIITGKMPQEHGLWSSYFYSPHTSPFSWMRWVHLPAFVADRARVRHWLSILTKKMCGFTGYFQLYNVPFSHLPLLDYAERNRIWQPNGIPGSTTIFDILASKQLPYYVGDLDAEPVQIARARQGIASGSLRMCYLLMGKLDALMHREGPDTPAIAPLLQTYESSLQELLALAHKNYDEVTCLLFSDHGMHAVGHTHDLQASVHALNLTWGKDYVALYDSTMARFWPLTPQAEKKITACLLNTPYGSLLSSKQLQEYGVSFPNGKYGTLIFLLQPGHLIVPSDMGKRPILGMHGYAPDDNDSLATLYANRPIAPTCKCIRDIFDVMCSSL